MAITVKMRCFHCTPKFLYLKSVTIATHGDSPLPNHESHVTSDCNVHNYS